MSVTGGLRHAAAPAPSWPRWFAGNVAQGLLGWRARPPRTHATPAWRRTVPLSVGALTAFVLIAGTMAFIDAPAIIAVRGLPLWLVKVFDQVTGYGASAWFLVPIAIMLTAIAAVASPTLPRLTQLVLVTIAVRLAFAFAAMAIPGLVVTVAKRLIGRARPFVEGFADPFLYGTFVWRPDYASFPSGHATDAFAALVAIGLVVPRLRAILWVYALAIAASRVALLAHHPSDVIAGALAGALGVLLVRDWFAARRLAFAIAADGHVHALPGPSFARIKKVARQLVAS